MFLGSTIRFGVDISKVSISRVNFTGLDTIQERFEKFHATNPQVYDALVKLTWQLKMMGCKTGSVVLIYELLRSANTTMIQKSSDGFGLSDNFRSRYSRMIMAREKGLEKFFNTKELQGVTPSEETPETYMEPVPKTPEMIWEVYPES